MYWYLNGSRTGGVWVMRRTPETEGKRRRVAGMSVLKNTGAICRSMGESLPQAPRWADYGAGPVAGATVRA